jgi:hypothetical protein
LVDKFEESGQCKGLDKANQLAVTKAQGRTKCVPAHVILADFGCCLGPQSMLMDACPLFKLEQGLLGPNGGNRL